MNANLPVNVLLVEDNPTDVLLTQEALEVGQEFTLTVSERLSRALEMLNERRFDVVLLDLGLPDGQGLDTLLRLRQHSPGTPVVIMTGRDDEELALRAVGEGAEDYLVKGQIVGHSLRRVIRYAIERRRAEATISKSKAHLEAIVNSAMNAIISVDAEQRIVLFNAAAEKMFGVSASHMMRKPLDSLIPERHRVRHRDHIRAFGETDVTTRRMGQLGSISGLRASGEEFPIEASISQSQAVGEKFYTVILRDISQRLRAEEMLKEREESLRLQTNAAQLAADRLSAVHSVFEILTGASSLKMIMDRVLELLCISLNWELGVFWLVDKNAGVLRHFALWYRSESPEFEELSRRNTFPPGVGLPGRIWATKQPHWIPDLDQDTNFPRIAAARREGLRSAFGLPISYQGNVFGVLEFFRKQVSQPDQPWMEMFESIGAQIGGFMVRMQAEEAVKVSQHMLETVLNNIPQGVFWKDRQSRYLGCNAVVSRALGLEEPKEAIGKTDRELPGLKEEQADLFIQTDQQVMESNQPIFGIIEQATLADASTIWLETNKMPMRNSQGQVVGILGTWQDITERRALEEQLRQAQKMEAFGQLAGGVAHDFNNLLTIISGYSDMLLGTGKFDESSNTLLQEIHKAGERAASLTRQLLAFSRKQILEPRVLVLNDLITEAEKMLCRLIGEDITLTSVFAPALGSVRMDPGQFEQVVINLAVNARDAMPQGGKLTIETANVELDQTYAESHPEVKPGRYVMMAVSDTGCGMDEATKARIFEPFFTTKGPGKGTGLGLATVFGIIKQSEGHIAVYSEPGQGTTFKVYLPLVRKRIASGKSLPGVRIIPKGNETILLVEDDDGVRGVARHALQMHGYSVLEASNGAEAIQICEHRREPIHLVVSDVVMPEMGGARLIERLTSLRPGIKVLFLSGYTDDAVVRHGVLQAEVAFLQKPFTPASLATKVRAVLDS